MDATAGRPCWSTATRASMRRSPISAISSRACAGAWRCPAQGEPRLLGSMSSRDLPAMRTMTWIADVRSGWEWDKAFDPWLERLMATGGISRHAWLRSHGAGAAASVRRSLGQRFVLHRADDLVAIPPQRKRPRELSLMRGVVQGSRRRQRPLLRLAPQHEPETAALDGERVARRSPRRMCARWSVSTAAARWSVPGPVRKMRRSAGRLSRGQGRGLLGRHVRHRR